MMHHLRSALVYAAAAALIFGAYHLGGFAATTLLTASSHAMAPPVPVTADVAERVASL